MIKGDPSTGLGTGEEKNRFAYDVRFLPWLILTDKKHVVVAEGFGVGDLDNQLKQEARKEAGKGR